MTTATPNRRCHFVSVVLMASLVWGLTFALPSGARADTPGKHSGYVHALNDLRDARGHLTLTVSRRTKGWERATAVVSRINNAMFNVTRAGRFVGKDMHGSPLKDAAAANQGQLHSALDLLLSARRSLGGPEDSKAALAPRSQAMGHVDTAIALLQQIIKVTGKDS